MPQHRSLPGRTPQTRRQGFLRLEVLEDRTVLSSSNGLLISGPAPTLSVAGTPADSRFTDQWAMNNTGQNGGTAGADIDATRAWNVTSGSTKTTVAIMDTGVDYTHPDLYLNIWLNQDEIPASRRARLTDINSDGLITFRDLNDTRNQGVGKITDINRNGYIDGGDLIAVMGKDAFGRDNGQGGWADSTDTDQNGYRDDLIGWNFAKNNNNPMDDFGHGTHVAGIIGAISDNAIGVAGVASKSQIMVLKFLDGVGNGSIQQYIAALNYSVKEGARITNNSWTGANNSTELTDAINAARAAGQIFVAAAGNGTTDNDVQPVYPASFKIDNVLSVAATDRYDKLASFSAYGDQSVHLAAPGVDILSTVPGGKYGYNSGTSMATPFVAGVAALVWSQNPSWTYKQVITQILSTVDKVASLSGKTKTGGRLNAATAVGAVQAQSTPPRIISAVWSGATATTLSKVRVTFDRAIALSTFTTYDVQLTNPAGARLTLSGVKVVSGTGDRTFEITFASQSTAGTYNLRVGPDVKDVSGNQMSLYTGSYRLTAPAPATAPKILSAVGSGPNAYSLSTIRVTFDKAINLSTFTTADVQLTAPGSKAVAISAVKVVSGSGDKVFDLTFATQSTAGSYSLRIGPDVKDTAGLQMTLYTTSLTVKAATVTTAPKVLSAAGSGPNAYSLSTIRVTFDQAINLSTFTTYDVQLTSPAGVRVAIGAVKVVAGSGDKVFDVTFATQTAPGTYGLRVGLEVKNTAGVQMSSAFVSSLTVKAATVTTAPKVLSAAGSGPDAYSLSTIRVTFDKAINLSTFTTADVQLTAPGSKAVAISAVKVVSGSGDKVFDLTFATQSTAGSYSLRIGPDVKDTSGLQMTLYTTSLTVKAAVVVTPPKITSAVPGGPAANTLSKVRVTFDKAINLSTFTTADVQLTAPGSKAVAISAVTVVSGSGNKVFEITFATQSTAGSYSLRIGPDVKDTNGVQMTLYTTSFQLAAAPRITGAVWSGPAANTLSKVRVTFDKAINLSTFTTADVQLTAPGSKAVAISAVTVVSGSDNKVFDLTFATQSTAGSYSLRVGPDVKDTNGLQMTVYTGSTQIGSAVRTYATATQVTVPKGGQAVSMITIDQATTIKDINIKVNIAATRASDLYLMLQAPDGTTVVLFNRYGGSTANLTDTVFDDAASKSITLGIGPFTGSFQPLVPLSTLNGKSTKGTWKLWVIDKAGTSGATIKNWSVQVTG